MTTGYSDEQLSTIRQMWLDGHNDSEIGEKINRSERAIRNQRAVMRLTRENYPNRVMRSGWKGSSSLVSRNVYTAQEEADILASLARGEAVASIAARYNVGSRTMERKINRLLIRDPVYEPTARTCLSCDKSFFSEQPKKINRLCPDCLALA